MKKRKLMRKQEVFCRQYIIDHNATAAARRAKYHPKMAAQLMAIPSIRERIEELDAKSAERLSLTADYVKAKILALLEADPAQLRDKNGEQIRLDKLPASIRRVLTVQTDSDGKTVIWTPDIIKAYALAAKVTGLLSEKVELSGAANGPIIIEWGGDKPDATI